MKFIFCFTHFESVRLVIWFLMCFYTGWWLVPSRAYSESKSHRFLPTHEYQGEYKEEEKAKYFMWEVDTPTEADIKPDFSAFLDQNSSQEVRNRAQNMTLSLPQFCDTKIKRFSPSKPPGSTVLRFASKSPVLIFWKFL